MMTEQDRINANDYHYANYERIYNAKDLAEAKSIAVEEMKIIYDDNYINKDDEKIEPVSDKQSNN